MNRIISRIGLLVCCVVLLLSFVSDKNRIFWNEKRDLQWADFQGVPDYSDDFRAAVTASAINFTTRCETDGTLSYRVSAQFIKNQSWVKPEAHNDYHLGHEQLHFDITELHVRKIKKALHQSELYCEDEQLVQTIAKQYMVECNKMQSEYDKATRFSLLKTKQKEWEEKISKELGALSQYK